MTSRKPALLVTRRLPPLVRQRLLEHFDASLNDADEPLDRPALAFALRAYDAILPTITDVLDATLFAGPGVRTRIIANFGAGVEHIDLEAARRAGIAVTNTPDALVPATADIALLLMLMAARRAGEGERSVRAGQWRGWSPTHMMGQGLTGKTLGLLGFGRIAQAVGLRAMGLGMRIIYHSRRRVHIPWATFVPAIETLAAEADVVSVHVPGGDDTRHLVNAAFLRTMKSAGILINTARGSVVDEAALAEALARRSIAAAGLDVYEREPRIHPALLECENAVLLPHLGSATVETRTAMGMQAADALEAFFAGRALTHRVA